MLLILSIDSLFNSQFNTAVFTVELQHWGYHTVNYRPKLQLNHRVGDINYIFFPFTSCTH